MTSLPNRLFLPSQFFSARTFCGFSETFEAKMRFSSVSKQALTLKKPKWFQILVVAAEPTVDQPIRTLQTKHKAILIIFFFLHSHLKDQLEGWLTLVDVWKEFFKKEQLPLTLHLGYPCAAKQKNPFTGIIATLLALFFYDEGTLRGEYRYQRLSSAAFGLLTVL